MSVRPRRVRRHGVALLLASLAAEVRISAGSIRAPPAWASGAFAAASEQNGSKWDHGLAAAVVVPLRAASTPMLDSDEAFYVGSLSVGGLPAQEFSVLFDTAAGNIVLPAASCSDSACLHKRKYSPLASSARAVSLAEVVTDAVNITGDRVEVEFSQIELGDGVCSGHGWRDTVCLAAGACAEVGIVVADHYSDVPFRAMPHDGMLGLGLDGLTVTSPLFSLMKSLVADGASTSTRPTFSLALRGPTAELAFGGTGPSFNKAAPPIWRSVVRPEDGYWQVPIYGVRVGDVVVDACPSGCMGIIDTGAARLGVPAATLPPLMAAVAAAGADAVAASVGRCGGAAIHLDLGAGESLSLPRSTYAGPSCSARLVPLNLGAGYEGIYVLGLAVLKRYDTIFDWGLRRVGFSFSEPRAVRLGAERGVAAATGAASAGPAPRLADLGDFMQLI